MDFDLDKSNTKVEAENCCDAKARLQDDSLSSSIKFAKLSVSGSDSLPSIKLTDAREEGKAAKADELPISEMVGRHHYPASYPYDHAPPNSQGGTRYEQQGGKVVIHRG